MYLFFMCTFYMVQVKMKVGSGTLGRCMIKISHHKNLKFYSEIFFVLRFFLECSITPLTRTLRGNAKTVRVSRVSS